MITQSPGLLYAVTLRKAPHTWCFVMELDATKEIVGYILVSLTLALSKELPRKRVAFSRTEILRGRQTQDQGKPADERYAELISKYGRD